MFSALENVISPFVEAATNEAPQQNPRLPTPSEVQLQQSQELTDILSNKIEAAVVVVAMVLAVGLVAYQVNTGEFGQ